jgi:hypothetical protein
MNSRFTLLLCATLLTQTGYAACASDACSGCATQKCVCAHEPVILKNPPSISAELLKNADLVEIRADDQQMTTSSGRRYTAAEIALVTDYLKHGGALLVVIDEERRTPLHKDGVAALLAPFGIGFGPDNEYIHNCGARAKSGIVNKQDREIPYSGGRNVTGGTPFAWWLDAAGTPAGPMAAYAETDGGGKIVALSEAMAYIGMGVKEGVRLSGVPHDAARTTYWGKDSAIFMQEVRTWLADNPIAKRNACRCSSPEQRTGEKK